MGKRYRLKCRFCLTTFDWPDKGEDVEHDDVNEIAIICPGDEKAMIASHVEILRGGDVMNIKERFWIMKEY